MSKLIEIQDLRLRFYTYAGVVKALEGVNTYVTDGETLGIVGETGCGKTTTGLAIFKIVVPPGKIEHGKVLFKTRTGRTVDLLKLSDRALTWVRGRDISMVFQEPSSSLNPVFSVGNQVSEVFFHHRRKEMIQNVLKELEEDIQEVGATFLRGGIYKIEKKIYNKMLEKPNSPSLRIISRIPIINRYKGRLNKEVKKAVVNLLGDLEFPDPDRVFDMYPHELSGGMQQRIVIAMALACNPLLLMLDEPTTSLDVTIQAQVLNLVKKLKMKYKSSVLFITHNLGVIAEMADRVAIMYAGNVVEVSDVREIFKHPLHPYTKGLMESIPRAGKEYKTISGTVPDLIEPPLGCRFHPRCSMAMPICTEVSPKMVEIKKDHLVSCHLFGES
jgi:peptide/nickel transport system ATP-binding protein